MKICRRLGPWPGSPTVGSLRNLAGQDSLAGNISRVDVGCGVALGKTGLDDWMTGRLAGGNIDP